MNKFELSLLAGMVAAVFFSGMCAFADNHANITDNVFRLHILANSDSPEDQALKLAVRDAILEKTAGVFEVRNAEEAQTAAMENIALFEETARIAAAEYGADCGVTCEVVTSYFPAREYGGVTLPAGEYRALRVKLGEADGQNWWCVMFPRLCLPVVTGGETAVLADYGGVFSEEETQMLENPEKYEVRFYFAELYFKLKNKS